MTLPSKTAGSPDGLARHMVGLAQLAERLVVVQEVAGSTPVAHPHEGHDFPPLRKGRTGYPVRPLLVPVLH